MFLKIGFNEVPNLLLESELNALISQNSNNQVVNNFLILDFVPIITISGTFHPLTLRCLSASLVLP
jgi:hypothetical protein